VNGSCLISGSCLILGSGLSSSELDRSRLTHFDLVEPRVPFCTPRTCSSACREGSCCCTLRNCFSACRGGKGRTPRNCFSACHGGRGCTSRRTFSPCRADRGCTSRSRLSACRESRGCKARSSSSASRAGRGCTARSAVSRCRGDTGYTPCRCVSAFRAGTAYVPPSFTSARTYVCTPRATPGEDKTVVAFPGERFVPETWIKTKTDWLWVSHSPNYFIKLPQTLPSPFPGSNRSSLGTCVSSSSSTALATISPSMPWYTSPRAPSPPTYHRVCFFSVCFES